jgi:hypothetical protein
LKSPLPNHAKLPNIAQSPWDPPEVVYGILVVANKNRTAITQPSQGSFHYPAPRFSLSATARLHRSDGLNVRSVAERFDGLMPGRIVVAFVQTEMLIDIGSSRDVKAVIGQELVTWSRTLLSAHGPCESQ